MDVAGNTHREARMKRTVVKLLLVFGLSTLSLAWSSPAQANCPTCEDAYAFCNYFCEAHYGHGCVTLFCPTTGECPYWDC